MAIRRIPLRRGGGNWGPYFPQPNMGSFPAVQQQNPLSIFLSTFGNSMMPLLQQNYMNSVEDRRWQERQKLEQQWSREKENRDWQRKIDLMKEEQRLKTEAQRLKDEALRAQTGDFETQVEDFSNPDAIGGEHGLDPLAAYSNIDLLRARAPEGQQDVWNAIAARATPNLQEAFNAAAVGGVPETGALNLMRIGGGFGYPQRDQTAANEYETRRGLFRERGQGITPEDEQDMARAIIGDTGETPVETGAKKWWGQVDAAQKKRDIAANEEAASDRAQGRSRRKLFEAAERQGVSPEEAQANIDKKLLGIKESASQGIVPSRSDDKDFVETQLKLNGIPESPNTGFIGPMFIYGGSSATPEQSKRIDAAIIADARDRIANNANINKIINSINRKLDFAFRVHSYKSRLRGNKELIRQLLEAD